MMAQFTKRQQMLAGWIFLAIGILGIAASRTVIIGAWGCVGQVLLSLVLALVGLKLASAPRAASHLLALCITLFAIFAITPLLDDPKALMSDLTHVTFNDVIIAIILAVSLNLILGMTGQFSLGHGGFMAVGAYTSAVLVGKPELFLPQLSFWHLHMGFSISASFACLAVTSMVFAILAAALCGLLVGLPTLRLRGDYLAIATLGFGEIVGTLITNSDYLERTFGLRIDSMRQHWYSAVLADDPNNTLAAAVRDYNNNSNNFLSAFWILGGGLLTVWIIRNIKYSTTGRALLAIREDPIASEAVGVPTTRYKVAAFIIGAGLAGFAGAIFAHYQPLTPNNFRFMYSVTIVLYVILGGQGSITGSVLAAILLVLLPVLFQRNTVLDPNLTEKWRMVVFALLIILSTLFMRRGLFGRYEITDLLQWAWRKIRSPQPRGFDVISAANANQNTASAAAPSLMHKVPAAKLAPAEGSGVPLLCASNVIMQFGGLKAVDTFNLTLHSGELVGLIGPNGAGKTTVFNVLTGVYCPTSGDISAGGRSILRLKPNAISHLGIARTFQNIRLFAELSVLDNVKIAQHAHHKQGIPAAILRTPAFFREEAISEVQALEYLSLFNLASFADEQAGSLSYGDQRRLEIARALATRPRVLLLDEPAAGMNPTEKRELMEMIRSLRDRFGMTILLIEHDMKVVMGVCQRIIVLDYGKTIAQGTPEEIRRNPAVIQAYLGASA